MSQNYVGVGLGVIIKNKDGHILIGKRKGTHVPYYSIPGGRVEPGESFEQAAKREIKEETNLDIINPVVIAITNNTKTYTEEGIHNISIIFLAEQFDNELKLMEPHKCEEWIWVDPNHLPEPHFEGSKQGVSCYVSHTFYNPHI